MKVAESEAATLYKMNKAIEDKNTEKAWIMKTNETVVYKAYPDQ
jgi:hypothetical protein